MPAILDALMRRRRAWAVSLVSLFIGMLAIGVLGEAERDPSPTDQLPDGYQSTEAVELQQQFESDEESTAIVLFASDEKIAPDELKQLQQVFADAAPEGAAPEDAAPAGPPGLVPSEDGTAALGVVSVPGAGASQIADEVTALRDRLQEGLPEGVTAQVTGPAAVQADLAAVFEGANFRLLAVTASVVAVLLIITYRSPLLWLVPLAVVGIADRAAAALATHTLAFFDVAWDESTVGILSVLVFGAGTDYALLLISRYRDELRVQDDRYVAMRHATRRTAEAVLASATTVVLGLLTLLLSVVPTTRGLGLACAVGIVVAAAAALLALPFTLVLFGRWIFWPRTPRVGQATLVDTRSLWQRVGGVVARRPGTLIVVSLLVLVALASGVTQIKTGLAPADQFLDKPEAIAAGERLAQSFPAGTANPTVVITEDQPGPVAAAVQDVPGVSSVRPVAETPEGVSPALTRIDVVLSAAPGSAASTDAVLAVRDAVAPFEGTVVGGTEAQTIDERDAAARDRSLLIPLILGLVSVGLVLLLRSIVAPVILVASVVATYLAALGASWWLFTGVLGFERLDVGVPLLAFLFLVALGVDYNIFLVTRAAEESAGHGARDGMLRGLTATGGVITSAGILLAAVFAVLGVLPLVVLAQLGVVICIGVLLDTLLVRTILVPAVAVELGDPFWWPRKLS
ncbi:MAG TPA: MMPL family transporter [Marmoricola sp.]|nr:MMPL family transporter [Marmoricola sp.]